jgi:amino-acid N-acetyltransferase
MDIRRCGPADREGVLRLLETCGLPMADLQKATLHRFLVCELAGEIGGVAGLEACGPDVLLRSVAVRETARGQGIAAALVDAAEAAARVEGFHAIYLLTTTAGAYFGRRGWRTVDRATVPEAVKVSAEFSELCPASSTCMVKALARGAGSLP